MRKRRNGVPDIVLTVPEGALTVLPRLTPLNRRESHEESVAAIEKRRPGFVGENSALFDPVLERRVMKDVPVVNKVGFGGMKIAARRIDAQGPARVSISLPRGETHRVAQEPGNRLAVERCRGAAVNSPIARGGFLMRERDQSRARVPSKRIGLRRPIEVAARSGESTEMVLGGLVVFE